MEKISSIGIILPGIPGLDYKPVSVDDMAFLKSVYRSYREEELLLTTWNEQQKSAFINQQFSAQHQYYTENYFGAFFEVIQITKVPAGRLYLMEWEEEFRIIDITLLPEFRGKGWGSQILKSIMEVAAKKNKVVGIHVEHNNPAMNLYLRLGFKNIEDKGVYQYMVWAPDRN